VSWQILAIIPQICSSNTIFLHTDTPEQTLEILKDAMEEEMNNVATCLRNTFLNKIPTAEEILNTCNTLAEKLSAGASAKNDVKLALMDLLEEALQGIVKSHCTSGVMYTFVPFVDVMDYEPDADMVFNYLMVSALAEATDAIEKKGMKPTGGKIDKRIHIQSMTNNRYMTKRLRIKKGSNFVNYFPRHYLHAVILSTLFQSTFRSLPARECST
jgi:hypothetical protein